VQENALLCCGFSSLSGNENDVHSADETPVSTGVSKQKWLEMPVDTGVSSSAIQKAVMNGACFRTR
jgi:hypothetical protein